MAFRPSRLIWHHSGDADQSRQLAKINSWHKKRGFPLSSLGYYVGYHYLIEADGVVVQTRREDEIGAHDQGENPNSLGICFAGNFDENMPNEAQVVAAVRLVADIRSRHDILITRIEPHRFDDDTSCPGSLLSDNWLIDEYLKREGSPALRVFQWLGRTYKLI